LGAAKEHIAMKRRGNFQPCDVFAQLLITMRVCGRKDLGGYEVGFDAVICSVHWTFREPI